MNPSSGRWICFDIGSVIRRFDTVSHALTAEHAYTPAATALPPSLPTLAHASFATTMMTHQ
jgi:hypothetical protein